MQVFFSLAKFIIQRFGRESVEVIPGGVSSVSAGFAQIKNSWQDFRFKSVKQEENDLSELGDDTILLCDRMNTPEKILQDNPDLKNKFDITVMKDISLETEQIFYDPDESFNSSRVLIVLEKKEQLSPAETIKYPPELTPFEVHSVKKSDLSKTAFSAGF